jgi:hypothetical protein
VKKTIAYFDEPSLEKEKSYSVAPEVNLTLKRFNLSKIFASTVRVSPIVTPLWKGHGLTCKC